ncbi:MAG: guanylate kinase [Burkholderiaceae bacterium]
MTPASGMPAPSASGQLLIVVAPSGAGKTSLVHHLLASRAGVIMSVSTTTRAPRAGEREGVDYHFTTPEDFIERRDRGEFLEWARVHDNFYGTSKAWIEAQLADGTDIVLDIDWQGAEQIRSKFPEAVAVFIAPPSMAALRSRLIARGKDSPEVIERRLAAARTELEHAQDCQYVIVNQEFAAAATEFCGILDTLRCRYPRQRMRHLPLFQDLGM